jgi:hypothetical protein
VVGVADALYGLGGDVVVVVGGSVGVAVTAGVDVVVGLAPFFELEPHAASNAVSATANINIVRNLT